MEDKFMGLANYNLPDAPLKQVIRLSGAKTKRDAIILALEEYIKQKKREKLIQAYGKMPLRWTQKALKKYRDS